MTKAIYIADDGTSYCARIPTWETTITNGAATIAQTVTACTTQPSMPKGLRRRKRFYKVTSTGAERSFTVLSAASTVWSAPFGTGARVPLFETAAPTADNATLTGRTGERTKAI
jgi:hypothetical protein